MGKLISRPYLVARVVKTNILTGIPLATGVFYEENRVTERHRVKEGRRDTFIILLISFVTLYLECNQGPPL